MPHIALFAYGFRPFFLLAGFTAASLAPVWLWMYWQGVAPLATLPPQYWHAHEMIYGFVAAAIAGFFLTSVPSWTSARGFGGWPLRSLVLLWAAGRFAFANAQTLDTAVLAILELCFLPALALMLAPPLLRARNRNTPLLAVLLVLWLLDAAFIAAIVRSDAMLAQRVLQLAIDFVLVLVTVIGGRIVPSFTANALRRQGRAVQIVSRPWIDRTAVTLMVIVALVDLRWPLSLASGALAALAALAHGARLSGWRGMRMRGEPILWILHVAYAWLPIGFALKSIWIFAAAAWAAHWLHAFTMGVFGTMILAVMTRTSLGHTGRPLQVGRTIAIAYILLTAAVLLRVVFAAVLPDYRWSITAAGALWTASFLLFVAVYTPILVRPRADGKEG